VSATARPILFAKQTECSDLESVLLEVGHERLRQEERCEAKLAEGFNWHSCASSMLTDSEKLGVLVEEVGEVAKETCDMRAEGDSPQARLRLRTELIQVAAVAVAWAESL
jgi:hypothetical protein